MTLPLRGEGDCVNYVCTFFFDALGHSIVRDEYSDGVRVASMLSYMIILNRMLVAFHIL